MLLIIICKGNKLFYLTMQTTNYDQLDILFLGAFLGFILLVKLIHFGNF